MERCEAEVLHVVGNEVIKHSSSIQVHGKVGLLSRRAWNVLLSAAYDKLETQEEHTISMTELVEALEYNSNNWNPLKRALLEMMGIYVTWNALGKDHENDWGASSFMADIRIRAGSGVLTYAYSPFMRRMLHNPSMFARIDLRLQNKFQSKYGFILHEIMYDYFDASRQAGETPWMSIEQLRQLMGVEPDAYPKMSELSRCVIGAAIREVNEHSEWDVEARYRRDQRRIVAVKFAAKGRRGARIKLPEPRRSTPPPQSTAGPRTAGPRTVPTPHSREYNGPSDRGMGVGW